MTELISEQYVRNFNILVASTKGAAPHNQLMFAAVLLTAFERLEALLKQKPNEFRLDYHEGEQAPIE